RPQRDLPEVPGERAASPLRVRPGPGRGPGALAGRKADPGPTGRPVGPTLALVSPVAGRPIRVPQECVTPPAGPKGRRQDYRSGGLDCLLLSALRLEMLRYAQNLHHGLRGPLGLGWSAGSLAWGAGRGGALLFGSGTPFAKRERWTNWPSHIRAAPTASALVN